MQRLFRRIANAALAAGAAQLFWYLSLPLVARLYSPESLGQYMKAIAYIGVSSVILGLRADLMILTGRASSTWETFSSHIALARTVALVAALGAALLWGTNVISSNAAGWTGFVLISALLACSFMVSGAALIKIESESSLRRTAFVRSFVQSILQVGLYSVGVFGLVVGKLIGDFFGAMLRTKYLRSRLAVSDDQGRSAPFTRWISSILVSRDQLRGVMAERDAIKVSLPQVLLNSLSQYLPFLILPVAVSSSWLGFYGLAFSIIVAPVGLIATPVRQVLMSKFSGKAGLEVSSFREEKRQVLLFSLLMTGVAILGALFLTQFGGPALSFVFGDEWAGLEKFVLLLWAWAGAGLIATPSLALLLSRRRFGTHLMLESVQFLGRLISLGGGVLLFAADGTEVLYPFIVWNCFFSVLSTIWIVLRIR